MIIRLTKIAALTPESDPGNFPARFWITGHFLAEPKIGSCFFIGQPFAWSHQEEPVPSWASFHTSYVTAINGDVITTRNSVYQIERDVKPAQ